MDDDYTFKVGDLLELIPTQYTPSGPWVYEVVKLIDGSPHTYTTIHRQVPSWYQHMLNKEITACFEPWEWKVTKKRNGHPLTKIFK